MIGMVLNRYNFDVEVATDGEMALEMFRANPKYDLILMDVVMPVMDGISCVKQIREYESANNLKRTPIIIQTGKVSHFS
jgi:CheY-like chemotaxis protein